MKKVISPKRVVAMGQVLLLYPLYSSDLAFSDQSLFPFLKEWLGEERLEFKDHILALMKAYSEEFDKSFNLEKGKQFLETLDDVHGAQK